MTTKYAYPYQTFPEQKYKGNGQKPAVIAKDAPQLI